VTVSAGAGFGLAGVAAGVWCDDLVRARRVGV